jgi:hypothetical protein
VLFTLFSKIFAISHGYLPLNSIHRFFKEFNENMCIFIGFLLVTLGVLLTIGFMIIWGEVNFIKLPVDYSLRFTYWSTILIVIGVELIFGGFFIEILRIKQSR